MYVYILLVKVFIYYEMATSHFINCSHDHCNFDILSSFLFTTINFKLYMYYINPDFLYSTENIIKKKKKYKIVHIHITKSIVIQLFCHFIRSSISFFY